MLALGNPAQTIPKYHNDNKIDGASTQTVKTCDGGTIELKAQEKRVLDLHNDVRKKPWLEELCVDPTLGKAARPQESDRHTDLPPQEVGKDGSASDHEAQASSQEL